MTTFKNHNSLIINELKALTPPYLVTMASATVQVQTNTSSEEDWNTETTVTGGEMEL